MNKTIGIVLIIIGAVMLIWTGFTYTKKKNCRCRANTNICRQAKNG
jgi:hypothetical protein